MTTLKVNVIRKPTIKVKVLPNFPSSVTVSSPILLSRVGGNYAFSFDQSALGGALIVNADNITLGSQTGTGAMVRATSPTLVTPALGTPSAVVLTNATGTAAGLTAGNVTTNANLTGDVTSVGNATTLATVNANVGTFGSATQSITATFNAKGLLTAVANVTITPAIGSVTGLGTGVATFLATPSSANLRAALTDETGTGIAYFVGGALGTPASGVGTNLTGTAAGLTAGNVTTNANLTGDVTSAGNATTLATVNGNVGTFGSVLVRPVFTVNAKGLITAASTVADREKLAIARTYFVRSDGNDSNSGLVDSAGGAYATFNSLWSLISGTLDFGGNAVTIKIGGTTQTITNGFALNQPWTGGGSLIIDGGNGTISSAATCINNTVTLPGAVTIQNVTLTSSGGGAIATLGPGTITVGTGVIFGAVNASFRHLDSQVAGARISVQVPFTITGGGQMHILATGGGEVMEQGCVITVTGRIVFGWYAYGDRMGFVNASANTWKGSATITMTIATPAVVTWASHGLSIGDPVIFNTTGVLPTGVTAGTTYFIIAAGFGAGAFQFSTTAGGAAVNTSGTQSGVHNAFSITATRFNASGLANVFTNSGGITYFPGSIAGTGTNPGVAPYGYYN